VSGNLATPVALLRGIAGESAWLEVACVGYLFGRLRVEPT
jgi:hypothetical protein